MQSICELSSHRFHVVDRTRLCAVQDQRAGNLTLEDMFTTWQRMLTVRMKIQWIVLRLVVHEGVQLPSVIPDGKIQEIKS